MTEYLGTIFGELRIPCHVYTDGSFSYEDVECLYDPSELILPSDIAAFKDQLVDRKKKEAESRGAPFFDGPQVRLKDYGIKIEDQRTEAHKLVLKFGKSTWFSYSTTNRSLDDKILEQEDRKVSIREKYIRNPLDLNDVLANSTGCSATVISEPDHKLVMVERSMKLSQYPGLYGDAVAGFMHREKDLVDGKPNPFKTLQREAQEEAGITCSVNDLKLLGIGRAMDDLHGEIWGELRTPLTVQEIYSAPKKDKYEALRMFDIPFEPKEVLKYLIKTIDQIPVGVPSESNVWITSRSPKWVPAHAVNTIHSLEREYGHDKVVRTLKNI